MIWSCVMILWQQDKKSLYGRICSYSGMLADEITLDMKVRYPRTGTTGKILHLEQIRGETFAELDSTNLLYRIDQLIPATVTDEKVTSIQEDAKTIIEREREFAAGRELQDALRNIDQSCEGGG